MEMKEKSKKYRLKEGLYLVVDPAMRREELLHKLNEALAGGVDIVQIWNNWPGSFGEGDKERLISDILAVSGNYNVPVLVNEEWKLLKSTALDGVHFDDVPDQFEEIKSEIGRETIFGITC